jgi:hypothetical protein
MMDVLTQERHRADIFHQPAGFQGTIVELQHSPISEKERDIRERFYSARGRMYWLVHLHDETSFNATSFRLSFHTDAPIIYKDRTFYMVRWYGRSKQFIEKWKRSRAHVFFDINGTIFYLATALSCRARAVTKKRRIRSCPRNEGRLREVNGSVSPTPSRPSFSSSIDSPSCEMIWFTGGANTYDH